MVLLHNTATCLIGWRFTRNHPACSNQLNAPSTIEPVMPGQHSEARTWTGMTHYCRQYAGPYSCVCRASETGNPIHGPELNHNLQRALSKPASPSSSCTLSCDGQRVLACLFACTSDQQLPRIMPAASACQCKHLHTSPSALQAQCTQTKPAATSSQPKFSCYLPRSTAETCICQCNDARPEKPLTVLMLLLRRAATQPTRSAATGISCNNAHPLKQQA